jgi:prolyl oligopeptidase
MQTAVLKTLRAFVILALAGVLVASVDSPVARASDQSTATQTAHDDVNFDWLNATGSPEVTRWVAEQNAMTIQALSGPKFRSLLQRARSVNVAPSWDSFTYTRMGDWVYKFTTSKQHPRGVWERSSKEAFLEGDDAHWEILVDFDALSASEHRNWTIGSANPTCLAPRYERCMVPLSDGGGGREEWREFDLASKAFVKNGFIVRGDMAYAIWKDRDTLYVNQSGPEGGAHVGMWTISRGKPWSEAHKVYQGTSPRVFIGELQIGDQSVVEVSDGGTRSLLTTSGRILRLALPEREQIVGYVQDHWIIKLWTDWRIGDKLWRGGTVVAVPNREIESLTPNVETVIAPTSRQMVDFLQQSASGLYVLIYDNIRAGLYRLDRVDGRWTQHKVPLPDLGRMDFVAPDPHSSDLLIEYQSFLAPPTIYSVNGLAAKVVSQEKPSFDASPFVVDQFQATSSDGTAIPYFVVHARNAPFDGTSRR